MNFLASWESCPGTNSQTCKQSFVKAQVTAQGQLYGTAPVQTDRESVRKDEADGEGDIDGVASEKHFFSRLQLWGN